VENLKAYQLIPPMTPLFNGWTIPLMSSACSYSPKAFDFSPRICLIGENFVYKKSANIFSMSSLCVLKGYSATINLLVSPSPYMYVPSMSSAVCKLPYNRKDWQTFLRVCNSNILLSLYLSCALSLSLSFSVASSLFLLDTFTI
jgi:hypothetical protein